MRKKALAIVLAVCVMLANMAVVSAENGIMHYFLDIPFEGTTVENVNDLLTEEGCTGFIKNPKVWSGAVDSFQYLGHECRIQFDFHGKGNMSRVLLMPECELWGKGDAFRSVFQEALRKFLDLDAKLTAMYGEPNGRWFRSGIDKYNFPTPNSCFRPNDGKWSEDELMRVFDNDDQHLRIASHWGNVQMQLWTNAGREFPKGYYLTLHLQYDEKLSEGNINLIDYPGKSK